MPLEVALRDVTGALSRVLEVGTRAGVTRGGACLAEPVCQETGLIRGEEEWGGSRKPEGTGWSRRGGQRSGSTQG